MKRTFLIAVCFIAISLPLAVMASPVIRSGESVTIGQDQVVAGDLYAVGGSVALSGSIEGDVYAASGAVTLNAPVAEDATIVAGTVQVHAPVADDLRILAGEVTLADKVEGDVVVVGGTLHVLSTANVTGDIIFFGSELKVEGPVTGSIFGSADTARVDAAVGGHIEMTAYSELTLGDRANIEGYVTYKSRHELVRSQNAVVVGAIQKESIALKDAASPEEFLVPFLVLLFAALTLFVLARKHLPPLIALTTKRYGVHGLIGLAVLGGVPFVAIILMVSVLGFFIGLFLLALYAALVMFSFILAAIVVGVLIMKFFFKTGNVSLLSVAVGAIALQLLLFIPYIGFLGVLALTAMVVGSLTVTVYRRLF